MQGGLTTPHDRLKWAREKAGFEEATEAANAIGVKASTYLGHENGSRGLSRAGARYARFFRVSLDWLLENRGGPELSIPPRRAQKSGGPSVVEVPVLSWVSAGTLADPSTQIPVEDVPLLAFADLGRGDFFALKVDGDSMDRISPDGSTIVVNRADQTMVAGRAYVFSVRGETTYKLWQPEDPPYLQPYSTNPSHKPIFVKRRRDLEVIGRVKRSLIDL